MKLLALVFSAVLLSACAGSRVYSPSSADALGFQQRAVTQENGPLRVTAAVPDQAETLALTGLDLYEQGIQPVWLRVENLGDEMFWLTHKSIDPDYFSPIEVAYMNRKGYTKESQALMERWFWEGQLGRLLRAGESMQGIVYTHLTDGTKGFNLEAVGSEAVWDMTFFIEMPGFKADYMTVNFRQLYAESEIVDLTPEELVDQLELLVPCCSSSQDGTDDGLPFNIVLIADGRSLRRALFRGGWQETSVDDPSTVVARKHRYRGRPPDGVFYKSRPDGDERKELRIWMTHLTSEGKPVIVAQAIHDLAGGEAFSLDPDLVSSRNYVLQSFWYGQSLLMIAGAGGIPVSTIEDPAVDFKGDSYFTNGARDLLWLSDSPVALDDARTLTNKSPGALSSEQQR